MLIRNLVALMLFFTVIAPILLYTDRLASLKFSSKGDLVEGFATSGFNSNYGHLNLVDGKSSSSVKEPVAIIYSDNKLLPDSGASNWQSNDGIQGVIERKSTRVLSTTDEEGLSQNENPIEEVTDPIGLPNIISGNPNSTSEKNSELDPNLKQEQSATQTSEKTDGGEIVKSRFQQDSVQVAHPNARVRHLKDQLIRAKVYLSLPGTRNNPHLTRELRLRIKEVQRTLGDASKDSELPKNAHERLKTMEQTLAKGKQAQDDCSTVVKKLRAMLHSTEEQLRVHKKQTLFLTQLTAKTLPKGLHCLPLRLTTEYYSLNWSQQPFPGQEKLEDPDLYHYALFSDNVLAAAVVVNSTITHAEDPSKHVFHIITDRLNYAAMRMWFQANPPDKATIEIQNIEEFTWLNASYSPVLKQLGSSSMIDYYFRAHRASSDSNMKFRNPKYLSILNHLRFYLPQLFPKLKKVLFLDDDIVVQKDLTGLWSIDLKGNVNGAVETCGESFHRFDRYLNFSNPLISKNFDPHACGWAYGMNIFDLDEWKRQNITEVYHSWQKLNYDRQLWKLGTLPPGLITFWKRTYQLNKSWHVLGLGYNPNVGQKEIDRAAVIHYNGNMKPWLEIAIPKYRNYWAKHVDFDNVYLRECNINP
ncbi:putative galacturonosyltransferase 4 [Cucumis melo var. makuwa]|uniref:Hexosyltransferase n=1 Tax=Cucumis melo var. makuwa TaxID=1194695 RepID=A0A5D3CQ73_CUCMM|nr:putative galacturonosyltransferase 4 [Cucumis melo var. makuwa]TYK12469.1 putative galacturonosyltransferase 4 [Cucumis melo var. makuwa]